MTTPHETDEAKVREVLERLGPSQVRMLMQNGGWAYAFHPVTLKSLSEKDQEVERLKVASQAEQAALARAANEASSRAALAAERQATAAEKANTRATIALIIAIASMIVTIVGMLVVHSDTIRAAPANSAQAYENTSRFS